MYKTTEECRAKVKAYQQSKEGKAKIKAYRESKKCKDRLKEYRLTDKYQASIKKYQKTDKCKKGLKKYQQSGKGIESSKRTWRKKVYGKLVKYIDKYTDDDPEDIFDEDDTVQVLRQKFKEKYGMVIYGKYISKSKKYIEVHAIQKT